jgi:hypothetical protein
MSETPDTPAVAPATAKQPQDRKRKAKSTFTFTGSDGTIHTLPLIGEDAAEKVPFKFTRRLVMNPDDNMAMMAQGFALLDVVGAAPEAIEALGELSTETAVEIVGEWMGESQRSAD